MFDRIKVYDDLIPVELQNYFFTSIYGKVGDIEISPTIDFKVKYEATAKDGNNEPISFMHILKSNAELSSHLANFSLIPQMICSKTNKTLQDILYARIFLTMPYDTNLEHHSPHIDLQYPHTVVLYYVNDADGETVFFDNDHKVIKRVKPKKGRVAVFDGLTLHSAGIPTSNSRCIVNFNILT